MSLKEKAKKKYFKIKEVTCPAFPEEKVVFNSKGFNHIFYKGPRSGRKKTNAACRVRLLDRAVELLEKSSIHQEEDSYRGIEVNIEEKEGSLNFGHLKGLSRTEE